MYDNGLSNSDLPNDLTNAIAKQVTKQALASAQRMVSAEFERYVNTRIEEKVFDIVRARLMRWGILTLLFVSTLVVGIGLGRFCH